MSSSKMVSSLVMYRAFKKDGTSSRYSSLEVSFVEAVCALFVDVFACSFYYCFTLIAEFLGLTGDVVVCVNA